MYNMVHLIFSVLKEMELLSDEGAEKLGQALSTEILSSSVTDSQAQVHRVFEQVKKDIRSDLTLEPWIDHVKKLEKRVAQLEKPKTTNKSKKLAL